jgi:hypothetical protein
VLARQHRPQLTDMPEQFSDEIRECHEFADECRRLADETDNPSIRRCYLEMAERWLHLAHNPAFLEQISNFKKAIRR